MLSRRVIPCLDVRGGRVTKGVRFRNNVDLGDPVEMAVAYSDGGADELVFYDITASAERRPIDIGMVAAVAAAVRIPFAVGGGVASVSDMERGIELVRNFAPEHFEIMVENPESILPKVRNMGAVFVGKWTPESAGDFAAGPSHVLPTGGAARRFSGLTVDDFRRRQPPQR